MNSSVRTRTGHRAVGGQGAGLGGPYSISARYSTTASNCFAGSVVGVRRGPHQAADEGRDAVAHGEHHSNCKREEWDASARRRKCDERDGRRDGEEYEEQRLGLTDAFYRAMRPAAVTPWGRHRCVSLVDVPAVGVGDARVRSQRCSGHSRSVWRPVGRWFGRSASRRPKGRFLIVPSRIPSRTATSSDASRQWLVRDRCAGVPREIGPIAPASWVASRRASARRTAW